MVLAIRFRLILNKMNNTRILIVEDEILIAEDLKDTLFDLGFSQVDMAHDRKSAIEMIHTVNPQIVLLDIRMEGETDGLEIGKFIAENTKQPFIYITAHSDVAMVKEIVKTRPEGYITKPVKKSDLFAAISLALQKVKVEDRPKSISIKDGYSNVLIQLDKILFVEAEGNYLNIVCEDRRYVSRQSMESIMEEMNDERFFRIHRSYFVNTQKILKYSKKEIQIGIYKLPVSRNIGNEFEARMLK